MPELVTLPVSFFEYVGDYARPEFTLWGDRSRIAPALFEALEQWSPRIDDIEVLSAGKPSEQGLNFKLPLKRVSFGFGTTSFRFVRDDAGWAIEEETLAMLESAASALNRLSGVKIAAHRAAVAFHIQPRSVSFVEILRPFIASKLIELEDRPIVTMATVARWANRKITIDGSAVVANGIFMKLEREFPAPTNFKDITQQLKSDQASLFDILGIEEDRR